MGRGSVKQSLTCINIPLNEFSTTRNRYVVYIFWLLEGEMAIRGVGRDKVPVGCVFSGFEKEE